MTSNNFKNSERLEPGTRKSRSANDVKPQVEPQVKKALADLSIETRSLITKVKSASRKMAALLFDSNMNPIERH
jgi:hypothetical protein